MKKILILVILTFIIKLCSAQSFGLKVDSLPCIQGVSIPINDSDKIVGNKYDSVGTANAVNKKTCTFRAVDMKKYCQQADTVASVLPLFVSTTNNSDSNQTGRISILGSTGVGTTTLPTNFFSIGRAIKIELTAYLSGNSASTDTLLLTLGTVVLGKVTVINAPNSRGRLYFECILVCRSTGSTGLIMPQINGNFISSSIGIVSISPVAVNTTIANILDIKSSFSVANGQNFCVGTTSLVYIIH